jgi:hypothetical protein
VIKQRVSGNSEIFKGANLPGVAARGAANRMGNALANATGGNGIKGLFNNLKKKAGEVKDDIGRGVRRMQGNETVGDQLAGVGNELRQEFNELTGGMDNIKSGFRNLWEFIKP